MVDHQIVPAHMRHLERGIRGRDPVYRAADPVETRRLAVFKAARRHHLHPDANAHEGAALRDHRLFDRLEEATMIVELVAAGGKGPVAGQHDARGAAHGVGIAGDQHLARAGFKRHALKRFLGGVQVAGFVVDDDRGHAAYSVPLVEGTASDLRGSVSTASRKARATALNAASAMWWLLSPCSASTCKVMPPWVLRA